MRQFSEPVGSTVDFRPHLESDCSTGHNAGMTWVSGSSWSVRLVFFQQLRSRLKQKVKYLKTTDFPYIA